MEGQLSVICVVVSPAPEPSFFNGVRIFRQNSEAMRIFHGAFAHWIWNCDGDMKVSWSCDKSISRGISDDTWNKGIPNQRWNVGQWQSDDENETKTEAIGD